MAKWAPPRVIYRPLSPITGDERPPIFVPFEPFLNQQFVLCNWRPGARPTNIRANVRGSRFPIFSTDLADSERTNDRSFIFVASLIFVFVD